jgi:protein ImuA
VRSQELRRLHLAARRHGKLLFVVRGVAAARQASPAPLRLLLEGVEEMKVRIVKRKGPPVDDPIVLPAAPERLRALLAARRRAPVMPSVPLPAPITEIERRSHVLDRLVTAT